MKNLELSSKKTKMRMYFTDQPQLKGGLVKWEAYEST